MTLRLGQQWRVPASLSDVIKFKNMATGNLKISSRKSEAVEYNNKGHQKYLKVDFDDAIADYTKAIELDPDLAVAYYNRGTVLYRLGNYDLALKDFAKSVLLDPDNTEFVTGLTECQKMCA